MEISADHIDDAHFITYSLRQTNVQFSIGGQIVTNGVVHSDRVLLQGPTWQYRRSVYSEAFDFFRIYFPQSLLSECLESYLGHVSKSDIVLFGAAFTEDRALADLTRTLVNMEPDGGLLGPAFVDGIGLALAARLIRLYLPSDKLAPSGETATALVKWRLRRTLDYIDGRLGRPIYLAELSEVAGLSRVHFAAQFRAAMGCPPYAYILKRRIAKAQQLLLDRTMSLADVGLVVGFSSQAHFTGAFRKVTGTTPARWRNEMAT